MQPAVFLDRDNTLIAHNGDIGDPEQVRLIDGVAAGIRSLRRQGYAIVVVTNQGGVARGKYTEEDVDAVNQRIAHLVDEQTGDVGLIDRFYYCPYDPEAAIEEYRRDHPWRKPHPGMMLQAARDLGIDLAQSWLIGDQLRDVHAGRTAGCRTVLIANGEVGRHAEEATESVGCFAEAVEVILHSPSADRSRRFDRNASDRVRDSAGDSRTRGPSDVPASGEATGDLAGEVKRIRRAVQELTEDLRSDRQHRAEFTPLHLLAGVVQLLVLLCVLLGLLELHNTEVFLKWVAGAVLVQLIVITVLVVDMRR